MPRKPNPPPPPPRPVGRPRTRPIGADRLVTMHFTDDEYARIETAARADARAVRAWARLAILRALESG